MIPHQAEHPEWQRLDGRDRDESEAKEGNRSIFGRFRHVGKTWKVHADTKFAPTHGRLHEARWRPIRRRVDNTGKGTKLQTRPASEWLFIYLVP